MNGVVPLLTALLRRAFPRLGVLDLAALDGGGLYPWFGEAAVGVADPSRFRTPERDLLSRFRQRGGAGALAGFDRVEDAARAAGAPAAWGGADPRLVVVGSGATAGDVQAWTGRAGAMVLGDAAGEAPERVVLVLGTGGVVRQATIGLPDGRAPGALAALEAAVRAILEEHAADAAGGGWAGGARAISARLGGVTLLAPALPSADAVLPGGALIVDADGPRLRIALGVLPARPTRVRIRLAAPGPPPAFFVDGARHPAAAAGGAAVLDAAMMPSPSWPTILGLAAAPGGAAPRVERVEISAP